jgi:hypothetical protein
MGYIAQKQHYKKLGCIYHCTLPSVIGQPAPEPRKNFIQMSVISNPTAGEAELQKT